MEYRREGDALAIRLDDGDEIVSSLRIVCSKEGIRSARFSGIGACQSAEISHFDTGMRAYHGKKFEGMLEIVSLIGNVTEGSGGEPVIHAHMALGLPDFSSCGGHLVSAHVKPTCEISLIARGIRISRAPDAESGLNLQAFR